MRLCLTDSFSMGKRVSFWFFILSCFSIFNKKTYSLSKLIAQLSFCPEAPTRCKKLLILKYMAPTIHWITFRPGQNSLAKTCQTPAIVTSKVGCLGNKVFSQNNVYTRLKFFVKLWSRSVEGQVKVQRGSERSKYGLEFKLEDLDLS